jgi:hypothetical protein
LLRNGSSGGLLPLPVDRGLSVALGDTTETTDLEAPQLPMLGLSARHPLSPQSKRPGLQLPAHYLNDGSLIQPVVGLDGLKGRAILPGHLDDPVDVSACEGSFYGASLR